MNTVNTKNTKNTKNKTLNNILTAETTELTEQGQKLKLSYKLVKREQYYGIEIEQELEGNVEQETEIFTEFENVAEEVRDYLSKHKVLIAEIIPILDGIISGDINIKEALSK